MDIVIIISFLASILGIIGFFISYIKGVWRYVYYWILVRILNRKPISLSLSLINKYDIEPSRKLNSQIFKLIQNSFDRNTEQVNKSAIRPESMKINIIKKSNKLNFNLTIRIDEEPAIDDLYAEQSEIIHYNLIIKLAYDLRLSWSDLTSIIDLTNYIEKIETILKSELFKNIQTSQHFFNCFLYKGFYIKKEPKNYQDKDMNARISIKKDKIYLNGSNISFLNSLIKKYYLRRL